MNVSIAALAVATLAACAHSASAPRDVRIDDSRQGQGIGFFTYTGAWEHLRAYTDGRLDGTSSRSHRARDSVVLPFAGTVVRLYGVRGPNGGDAAIAIDGRYYGTASFFARTKQPHALVFESPRLNAGAHILGIVVNGDTSGSHRAYVNLDEAEILSGNEGG